VSARLAPLLHDADEKERAEGDYRAHGRIFVDLDARYPNNREPAFAIGREASFTATALPARRRTKNQRRCELGEWLNHWFRACKHTSLEDVPMAAITFTSTHARTRLFETPGASTKKPSARTRRAVAGCAVFTSVVLGSVALVWLSSVNEPARTGEVAPLCTR